MNYLLLVNSFLFLIGIHFTSQVWLSHMLIGSSICPGPLYRAMPDIPLSPSNINTLSQPILTLFPRKSSHLLRIYSRFLRIFLVTFCDFAKSTNSAVLVSFKSGIKQRGSHDTLYQQREHANLYRAVYSHGR